MKTLEKLTEEIDLIEGRIADLESEIDCFELDESEYIDQYDDMLDETNQELFSMLPSRILKQCDPIAYNCGLSDYVNSLDIEDDMQYKELVNKKEELESDLYDLEIELEEMDGNS